MLQCRGGSLIDAVLIDPSHPARDGAPAGGPGPHTFRREMIPKEIIPEQGTPVRHAAMHRSPFGDDFVASFAGGGDRRGHDCRQGEDDGLQLSVLRWTSRDLC